MRYAISLFLTALILGAAAGASGSPSDKTYIGLYADSTHATWCVSCSIPFTYVTIYACVLPSYRGARLVQFDVSYPSNVVPLGKIINCSCVHCEIVIAPFNYLPFSDCQSDWVWVWRQDVMLLALGASEAVIVPAPGFSKVLYASCETGFPEYPMTALTNFYFNDCGPIAVEERSWGAVKALFR